MEFFRAVPLLMLIIATWFCIGPAAGRQGASPALVIGLILYNGAVFAEIFRAGINAVPKGQSEAAYAIGMRKSMVMRIILIPQAVKIMLPALISQAIVALKDTSLGYAILAPGLTYDRPRRSTATFSNIDPDRLRRGTHLHRAQPDAVRGRDLGPERFAGEREARPESAGSCRASPEGHGDARRQLLALGRDPEVDRALDGHGAVGGDGLDLDRHVRARAQSASVLSAVQVSAVVDLAR